MGAGHWPKWNFFKNGNFSCTARKICLGVVAATSYNYNYYTGTEIATGDVVQLRVRKLGKETITLTTVATLTGGSFLFSQIN